MSCTQLVIEHFELIHFVDIVVVVGGANDLEDVSTNN